MKGGVTLARLMLFHLSYTALERAMMGFEPMTLR